MKSAGWFTRFANHAAHATGHPIAFGVAVMVVVVWGVTGPVFEFSDTWQLVINTGTTIITFLMVFLIQNSQNRDSAAVQIKLDELIRAVRRADNTLLDMEELDEATLEQFRNRYEALAKKARDGGARAACEDPSFGMDDDGDRDDPPRPDRQGADPRDRDGDRRSNTQDEV